MSSTHRQTGTSSEPVTPTQSAIQHPFANCKGLLEIIPNKIDIEEEARLYDELCQDDSGVRPVQVSRPRSPSLFSRESFGTSIWLADNVGESRTFARDVQISGWTSVGDMTGGGAYVVYDCVIKTKEGTTIHAHKRYTAFEDLEFELRRTLPRQQQRFIPALPPKAPLARYRPAFLDRRRILLQHWLSSILLHPDLGGCKAVREWVMD
ncbi:hypothetical protein BDZ89DRAFT_563934 [Hymenopellis radicata]|nr:hypothetical protein BDZ89DRAFT_563934 [Hymenopellis radicata]